VNTLASILVTNDYLRELCAAYGSETIDRRTYILERRRLIDEAVAGKPSAPPAIPEPFEPEATMMDLGSTMQLPRQMLAEDDE
jgi:hypothetical protein